ncbi:MAG: AAA family ATPase [Candidatus Taylorbacteria bacterium]|nr:AAA family ATPase [Candidatus Taylorbacteria bacterium]
MQIRDYLKQSSLYGVLKAESILSNRTRKTVALISWDIVFFSIVILVLYFFVRNSTKFNEYKIIVDFIVPKIWGLLLINICISLSFKLINFYLSSKYYFEKISKNYYSKDELYTFSAGRILFAGRKTDILHGFIDSLIGKEVFLRLGISEGETMEFYKKEPIFPEDVMPKTAGDIMKIKDIISYLYSSKVNFNNFLSIKGISEVELIGAVEFVIYRIEQQEYEKQWWRKEELSKIKGLAEDWSYGKTYLLDKYSRNVMNDTEVNSEALSISSRDPEINQIENALLKSSGSNALLIGDPGQEKLQVVWGLCRKIKKGEINLSFTKKRVVLLSVNSITLACKDKTTLETQISRILTEVIKAGNIIFVIDNFPQLISLSTKLGSDFINLIDPFLAHSSIQVIALSDTVDFHKLIESNKTLLGRFETIFVKPLSTEEIIKILTSSALIIEGNYKIIFTYLAIKKLAESANYYFPNGVSSDKASSLLKEIAPWAKRNGSSIVLEDDVLKFIEEKTNIPSSGKFSPIEKEKLLNLEILISEMVIGQKDAIFAVSNALRRARSGIRNENRPMGSFLFLGPTGVGKTETAKALARVFFGGEADMMRLDMSEYQDNDSMKKLIGSFTDDKPGVFSSMIREKQYGVVLLDEFEKTNHDVLNLFLQIFDEGYFSDMLGQKVNVKNIIFIATSNAGAEKIFEMVNAGKNPKDYQEEIIEEIVSRGLFKPELINRFDGTIIFKPLSKEDLQQIANLMLKRVEKRLIDKGIILNITDELINFIVLNGTNDAFGARPMNRLIQDELEGKIATMMISGEIRSGYKIEAVIQNNTLSIKII